MKAFKKFFLKLICIKVDDIEDPNPMLQFFSHDQVKLYENFISKLKYPLHVRLYYGLLNRFQERPQPLYKLGQLGYKPTAMIRGKDLYFGKWKIRKFVPSLPTIPEDDEDDESLI